VEPSVASKLKALCRFWNFWSCAAFCARTILERQLRQLRQRWPRRFSPRTWSPWPQLSQQLLIWLSLSIWFGISLALASLTPGCHFLSTSGCLCNQKQMGFLHLFFLIYLHLKACAPQALIIRFVLKTWNWHLQVRTTGSSAWTWRAKKESFELLSDTIFVCQTLRLLQGRIKARYAATCKDLGGKSQK